MKDCNMIDFSLLKRYLLSFIEYKDLENEQLDRLLNYTLKKCNEKDILKITTILSNFDIYNNSDGNWMKGKFFYNWRLEDRINIKRFIKSFNKNDWKNTKDRIKKNTSLSTKTIFTKDKEELQEIENYLLENKYIDKIKDFYEKQIIYKFNPKDKILKLLKKSFKYTRLEYSLLYGFLNAKKLSIYLVKQNGYFFVSITPDFSHDNEFKLHLPHHRRNRTMTFKSIYDLKTYINKCTNYPQKMKKMKIPFFYNNVRMGELENDSKSWSKYSHWIFKLRNLNTNNFKLIANHYYNGVDGTSVADVYDEEANRECEIYKINESSNDILIIFFPDKKYSSYVFTKVNEDLISNKKTLLEYVQNHFSD